jgi:ribosomal protein S18 acetylase RimI-like enzyme
VDITYVWRDSFSNEALNSLHAEAFQHRVFDDDWWAQVNRHSLGWVCAKDAGNLVGFVNVAWDGALHAFILDTVVAEAYRHRGIATQMVAVSVAAARTARCEWLHVDFQDNLRGFYFDRCGFVPTQAGLIKLV